MDPNKSERRFVDISRPKNPDDPAVAFYDFRIRNEINRRWEFAVSASERVEFHTADIHQFDFLTSVRYILTLCII